MLMVSPDFFYDVFIREELSSFVKKEGKEVLHRLGKLYDLALVEILVA